MSASPVTDAMLARACAKQKAALERASRMALPALRHAHSRPVFDGRRSGGHGRVPLMKLYGEALPDLGKAMATQTAENFLQFVGFPRSGHSLIGSLIDAHADALIAHELDAMGLVAKGVPAPLIRLLIAHNTASFERHGRFWNGYSYAVEGGHGGRAAAPLVIGDKKGDLAVRWSLADPGLPHRMAKLMAPLRPKWIQIVRNPFDNIATMSLRQGRAYDRLRIGSPSGAAFREALAKEMGKSIPTHVSDAMIEDYAALCEGCERLRAGGSGDWLTVGYDDFTAAPREVFMDVLRFSGLRADPDFAARATRTVAASPHQSRHLLHWTPAQKEFVTALTERHDFLRGYGF